MSQNLIGAERLIYPVFTDKLFAYFSYLGYLSSTRLIYRLVHIACLFFPPACYGVTAWSPQWLLIIIINYYYFTISIYYLLLLVISTINSTYTLHITCTSSTSSYVVSRSSLSCCHIMSKRLFTLKYKMMHLYNTSSKYTPKYRSSASRTTLALSKMRRCNPIKVWKKTYL